MKVLGRLRNNQTTSEQALNQVKNSVDTTRIFYITHTIDVRIRSPKFTNIRWSIRWTEADWQSVRNSHRFVLPTYSPAEKDQTEANKAELKALVRHPCVRGNGQCSDACVRSNVQL